MSPVGDRIVELAAVRIDRDNQLSRFQTLVNPGRRIPPSAIAVHHITNEMIAPAPTFAQVGREFLEFASDSTLVAHNARFDLGFLQESLSRTGLPLWKGKTIDSLRLVRTLFPGLSSYSLQSLRKYFQLESEENMKAHRAGADVEWTRQILEIALTKAIRLRTPVSPSEG